MKKEKTALQNLYDLLTRWTEGRTADGIRRPAPADVGMLIDIYDELLKGRKSGFISSGCHDVLSYCGFRPEKRGVGWTVEWVKKKNCPRTAGFERV